MLKKTSNLFSSITDSINQVKLKMLALRCKIVEINLLCISKPWLLDDPIFFEYYNCLIDMENESVKDIETLETTIILYEKACIPVLVADLTDELDIINENIFFEYKCFECIKEYLSLISDNQIEGNQISECLERIEEINTMCTNQRTLNDDTLKKLRKERRDTFEQN